MYSKSLTVKDANEAAAQVAYKLSELVAMYPITPSSPMAEHCDAWSAAGQSNLWGTVPQIAQLQSEGGVAGAVHGALQAGALTTTFTASQGLLLMLPNMYKIAGELTPFCMHVTARSLATHALSIFGDHSDVMCARMTGFGFLASNSVQEAHDLAAIAHAATLEARIPLIHFFDGFRTSHEVNAYTPLTDAHLKELISAEAITAFRERALDPNHPVIRGTAQNPDVFFQCREAANPYFEQATEVIEAVMARFAKLTGRAYRPFEYVGDPEAERVIVAIGSGTETCELVAQHLNESGGKTGLVKVRLYRPFSAQKLAEALPASVRRVAVLDRTKEPGAVGEPLYQDVVTALMETGRLGEVTVTGGRYGLGSKEFNPAMAKAVYDSLAEENPRRHFTVGIEDDVSRLSLPVDEDFRIEDPDAIRAVFYGLGSDGTVGANKNTIKIIGECTDYHAQAYFVYDSKKSGALTVSHLRFGPNPIRAPYLIEQANFVGCHQWQFIEKIDVAESVAEGGVLLLNAVFAPDKLWEHLPRNAQQTILERKLRVYAIDAYKVAREAGMGGRINTVMQTAFFALSGVLPADEAIAQIKQAIEKTYGKRGPEIVKRNCAAVDQTLANLCEVPVPAEVTSDWNAAPTLLPDSAPEFIRTVTAELMAGKGDRLPVSAFPADGTWPSGTAKWEKRSIAQEVPVWDPSICIQCNKCALVCPHAAIRAKFYDEDALKDAPEDWQSVKFRSREVAGKFFTIQVAPEDCTGCTLCVHVCPSKDKHNPRHKAIDMTALIEVREREQRKFTYFEQITPPDRTSLSMDVKGTQFRQPLFEYSGACAGCGETPYIKLLTQLVGDRLLIANATGCSSIYGGNLPTTPYTMDHRGRGPAWSNSLFEDNAEFGLGMRLAADKRLGMAFEKLEALAQGLDADLVQALKGNPQVTEAQVQAQREYVERLKPALASLPDGGAQALLANIDDLVRKSVWVVGGDGWAYDIGYGGLDHVLASGEDVNILVLDTEVYSNTGGQQSKSTPLGAVAKFAAAGKARPKKDLGRIAMGYGNVYVASIAMGAKDTQTVNALAEAESFRGPSLVIAYSHCIAHGFNLGFGMEQQKRAMQTGYWPLYRYDPRREAEGEPALKLDSPKPKLRLQDFLEQEARYKILMNADPERAATLAELAQEQIQERYERLDRLSKIAPPPKQDEGEEPPAESASTNGAAK